MTGVQTCALPIWHKSENCNGVWTTISQIKPTITGSQLQNTICYRRTASNRCNEVVYSNIVTITVYDPAVRDSAYISEGGELGSDIKLVLFGKSPWTVILRRTDLNVQSFDTLKLISQSPYLYSPTKVGTYTVFKVNGNVGRGSGSAIISPKLIIDNSLTTAIMSGGGVLGDTVKVKFVGRKKFPLQYIYVHKINQVVITTDTIKNILDSIYPFVPSLAGSYEGISIVESDGKIGVVFGSADIAEDSTIIPNDKIPTADITGGGILGSKIIIRINANGTVAPWTVLIGIEYDSAGTKLNVTEEYEVDKTPFSFPSKRAGTYRIKRIGDYDGSGVAFVYVTDRDSSEVFVWNAVSPNGDGKNDVFEIDIPKRLSDKSAEIVIFDREGTKLANLEVKIGSNLPLNPAGDMFIYTWNCKNEAGELLNPGSYFFSFKVEGFEKDKTINKAGFIEIRR